MQHLATAMLRWSLLLAAVSSATGIARQMPVTTPDMRATGPLGEWRLQSPEHLYNAGDYFIRIAYKHIEIAAVTSYRTGRMSKDLESARQSRVLSRHAVARSPADSIGWSAFSFAALVTADPATSEYALRRSWQLAPFNAGLAPLRLRLFAYIDPNSLEDDLLSRISNDVKVAQREAPKRLQLMKRRFENIAAIVNRASALSTDTP